MKNPAGTAELEELDLDLLDQVQGGAAAGVYFSVGSISPGGNMQQPGGPPTTGGPASTTSYTVAVGLQSSFPYVTGGIYETTGTGYSSGASVGGSVGGFVSTSNADGVFTGPSSQQGLAIDGLAKAGVETSGNDSGFTVGVGAGAGVGLFGVQASNFDTNTTSLTGGPVDHSSPTIDQPVYDGMGNATGFTESVPNPNYDGGHTGDDGHTDPSQSASPSDPHTGDPSTTTPSDPSSPGDHGTGDPTASAAGDPSASGGDHSTPADPSASGTPTGSADHGTDTGTTDTGSGSGNMQGGFDNNNGEGGDGGGDGGGGDVG